MTVGPRANERGVCRLMAGREVARASKSGVSMLYGRERGVSWFLLET